MIETLSDFRESVAALLRAGGVDARNDGYYLIVEGCKFDTEEAQTDRKTGKLQKVKFLGSKFRRRANGTFDLTRAVWLVMAELPKRIRKREVTEMKAIHFAAAHALAEKLNAANAQVEVMSVRQIDGSAGITSDERGVGLILHHPDPAKIEEALSWWKTNG